jgi:asparagine synthase (glutamine-hydrolysing)
MCGIAGIFLREGIATPDTAQLVREAVNAIKHRGPDHQAVKLHGAACLGHARLSIIDTSPAGHQPMQTPDGRYTITFNGELFNYKSLKKELLSAGYNFHSESDTEVALIAYAHYGKSCVHYFNGFFAMAVYDGKANTLFAARDRMGIKPLYYSLNKNGFSFGSELQALRGVVPEWEVNHTALRMYFQLTYVPAPLSMISGVKKLLPGHCITVDGNSIETTAFFSPEPENRERMTFAEAAAAVRNELERSVQMRMVSDVPLGTFLSGGIDSSIVSLISARLQTGIATFSLGFKDSAYLDESDTAEMIARHIGSRHHRIMADENDLKAAAAHMFDHLDEPFADSSAVAVNLLSRYTSEHVKVALSGDGADELFGGYRKYRALLRSTQDSFLNRLLRASYRIAPGSLPESRSGKAGDFFRKLQKYRAGLGERFEDRYIKWLMWTDAESVNDLLIQKGDENDILKRLKNALKTDDLNTMLIADQKMVLPDDMLTKTDRMSMSHGLEVRTPFLDHELVKLVNAMPFEYKCNLSEGKLLLRKAFENDLPADIFRLPKKGFEIPVEQWLRGGYRSELERVTERQLIMRQAVFNPEFIEAIKTAFLKRGENQWAVTLWSVIVFQHWWLRNFEQSTR